MNHKIYIKTELEADSEYVDLNSTYGVRLLKGSYETLLSPPTLKDYITNDSRLQNGVQYARTGAKVKQRELRLSIILEGDNTLETKEEQISSYYARYESFLAKLTSDTIICLKVMALNRIFKLVYSSCEKFEQFDYKASIFTLSLVEPDPSDRQPI